MVAPPKKASYGSYVSYYSSITNKKRGNTYIPYYESKNYSHGCDWC